MSLTKNSVKIASTHYDDVHTWKISSDRYLFHDAFINSEGELIFIVPVYMKSDKHFRQLKVFSNHRELQILESIEAVSYEPIVILRYKLIGSDNNITVLFGGQRGTLNLIRPPAAAVKRLSLSTLFKDDFKIFPLFYQYYRNQGVEDFFMYYNGRLTPEIRTTFNLPGVKLLEWSYHYWNKKTCDFCHHAQMTQMHHALYKYGKGTSKYMVFCDLDEYLSVPHSTISSILGSNKDTYGFLNQWAEVVGDFRPEVSTLEDLKSQSLMVSSKLRYNVRSKCVHKVDSLKTLHIHVGRSYKPSSQDIDTNYSNFHFYNWCKTERKEATSIPAKLR